MLNTTNTGTVSLSGLPANETTTTVEQYANASYSVMNGFASTTGLGDVTLVVMWSVLLMMAAGYATSHYKRYERVRRLVAWLFGTFDYFIYGVATLAVVAVAVAPAYLFVQTDGETQGWLLRAAGVALVGYVGVSAVGYVGAHVFRRVRKTHERAQAEFGDPDEDESDESDDGNPDVALDGDGGNDND